MADTMFWISDDLETPKTVNSSLYICLCCVFSFKVVTVQEVEEQDMFLYLKGFK